MKKIKIMLTAVIILGTVGGVLAFKAKRDRLMCTAPTVNNTCPAVNPCVGGTQAAIGSGGPICTTPTQNTALCAGKNCPVFARTLQEGGGK